MNESERGSGFLLPWQAIPRYQSKDLDLYRSGISQKDLEWRAPELLFLFQGYDLAANETSFPRSPSLQLSVASLSHANKMFGKFSFFPCKFRIYEKVSLSNKG